MQPSARYGTYQTNIVLRLLKVEPLPQLPSNTVQSITIGPLTFGEDDQPLYFDLASGNVSTNASAVSQLAMSARCFRRWHDPNGFACESVFLTWWSPSGGLAKYPKWYPFAPRQMYRRGLSEVYSYGYAENWSHSGQFFLQSEGGRLHASISYFMVLPALACDLSLVTIASMDE
jgi:hypothetical protein